MADAQERFLRDFVAAWTKAMNLDRSDLRHLAILARSLVANLVANVGTCGDGRGVDL